MKNTILGKCKFSTLAGLFLFCFPQFVLAQSHKIDSLQKIIHGDEDTNQANAYLKLAGIYRNDSSHKALMCSNKALQISIHLSFKKGIAYSHLEMSRTLHTLGRQDKAMEEVLLARDLLNEMNDSIMVAESYSAIGGIYLSLNNYKLALESYIHAEVINRQIGNELGIIAARHNEATVLSDLKQKDKSVKIYQENLILLNKFKDNGYLAATYNNLGNIYKDSLRFDLAIEYLQHAYQLKKGSGNKYGLANTCNNLGETFTLMGKFDLAQKFLDEGLEYCKLTNATDREIENNFLRSHLAEKMNDPILALDYLKKVIVGRDSLLTNEQAIHVSELEWTYDFDKVEARNSFLQKQNEDSEELSRNKNIFLIVLCVALFVVMGLLILLIWNFKKMKTQRELIIRTNLDLKEKNEQLEDINREKDGLISIVAHDLRAPLNRSSALAQLISSSGGLNPDQLKFVGMISKVAEDGSLLIQDLLEISSYQQSSILTELRSLRLNDFIEGLLKGYYPQAEAKQLILHFTPGSDPEVMTDHQLLARVVDNLLSNAIKFSPRGKNIFVTSGSSGKEAFISVRDEGPGISTEEQKKLFRKFQRLSSRPTGGESSTGLGLAIVKILVEKLQGKIEVRSDLGMGCEFRVLLPIKN